MEKFFKISTAAILVPLLFALYSPSAGWAQTVSIAGYRVITSPTPVKPGESITFSWQAPSDHSTRDWIGLFLNFQPSNGATTLKLKFVPSGTSGFITMTTPATQNGLTYELRYFLKDGWTEAARSNPITVSSKATAPTAPPPPPPSPPATTAPTSTSTTPTSGSGTTSTPTEPSSSPTPSTTSGPCPNGAPLAFEGAEGYGRCAQGGRGGVVVDVTNLNDSGPGSLRDCAQVMSGRRTCRIMVAGTVSLGGYDITIRNDNVTIDGSAYPMALKDGGIAVRANHTIIRHLRVRPGPYSWITRGYNANGIVYLSREDGSGTWDHIADHVSVSWTTDDSIGVINGAKNITIQDSIIAEGLISGAKCSNCSSKGILVGTGNKETLSVLRTLSAHVFLRFPNATGGEIDWVNNVDYNSSGVTSQIVPYYWPVHINMVGNYYKDGPTSRAYNGGFNLTYNVIRTMGSFAYSAQSGIYVADNIGRHCNAGDPPKCIIWGDNGGITIQAQRYPHPQMSTVSAAAAYDLVLNNSGAKPRDAADARVVSDVRNGTGAWISDPLTVGGWPVLSSGLP